MTSFKKLMNLTGRMALVTGAGGSLGRVICETIAELGADVVLVDLPNTNLLEIKMQIENDWSVDVQVFETDLGRNLSRQDLINEFSSRFDKLDILINNAAFVGTSNLEGWATELSNQSSEIWGEVLEVNLTSAFHLVQKFMPLLLRSNCASIINIASIYGELGPDWRLYEGVNMGNPAAYSASKGGLIQLTRWLATSIGPKIRVNSISPGGLLRGQPKEFIDRYSSKTPMGRMGNEDDLRGAIGYLASDLSKYVTGENIHVDGGWSIW